MKLLFHLLRAKKLIDGGYNNRTVTMGIRPEDVKDDEMMAIAANPNSCIDINS